MRWDRPFVPTNLGKSRAGEIGSRPGQIGMVPENHPGGSTLNGFLCRSKHLQSFGARA